MALRSSVGAYRGTDVNPTGGPDVAPTVFVKGAR